LANNRIWFNRTGACGDGADPKIIMMIFGKNEMKVRPGFYLSFLEINEEWIPYVPSVLEKLLRSNNYEFIERKNINRKEVDIWRIKRSEQKSVGLSERE
jgi:hypothetical protein